jgi:hypothetical protein
VAPVEGRLDRETTDLERKYLDSHKVVTIGYDIPNFRSSSAVWSPYRTAFVVQYRRTIGIEYGFSKDA